MGADARLAESRMEQVKSVKRGRRAVSKQWTFYFSNGDLVGVLTFTKPEIVEYFPTAKIKKNCVYL